MIKALFKFIFKLAVAASAIAALLAAFFYFTDNKADYIEVYSDEDEGEIFE